MSKFDLAEEIAIANMIEIVNRSDVLEEREKIKIYAAIKKHIIDSADKILADNLKQTIEVTPIQSEADKLWANNAGNSNSQSEEDINSLWGESQHHWL